MPKISYKFTIPQKTYKDFKSDISRLAHKFDLSEKVVFDDEKKSCHFLFSADLIEKLFIDEIANVFEKYPFLSGGPANYQNCERFEGDKKINFKEARQHELKSYERLKLKKRTILVLSQKILQNEDFPKQEFESDIIIGEYHPDPLPKEFLIDFMDSYKSGRKPIIAIERFPAALNEELQKWLKDGQESELPKSISKYCDFIDKQNNSENLDFAENRDRSTRKLLEAAKRNGFDVLFFESEHSAISCDEQSNRHECLVTSLHKIRQSYENRNFLVLAGAYHDSPQFEDVTMSRALDAKSCVFFSKELFAVFIRHQQECLAKNDVKNAKIYEKMAGQISDDQRFSAQVREKREAAKTQENLL